MASSWVCQCMSSLCAISVVTDLFTVIAQPALYCTVQLYSTGQAHCTLHCTAGGPSVGTYKVAAALITGHGDTEYLHTFCPLIGQWAGDLASDWSEECHGILMTLSQPLISEMSAFWDVYMKLLRAIKSVAFLQNILHFPNRNVRDMYDPISNPNILSKQM